jgi:DNA transformation protein
LCRGADLRYLRDMPVTPSFRDYVVDQLGPVGDFELRRMFSGAGLFYAGKMFGLIHDDCVYLRVDDESRPEFVRRGMEPLRPMRKNPDWTSQNYYQLPGDVLDDGELILEWARRAIVASRQPTAAVVRAAKKKAAKKKVTRKAAPPKAATRKKAAPTPRKAVRAKKR